MTFHDFGSFDPEAGAARRPRRRPATARSSESRIEKLRGESLENLPKRSEFASEIEFVETYFLFFSATVKSVDGKLLELLDLLKTATDKSLVSKVASIVEHLAASEFSQANSEYLALTIGNAQWPIGGINMGVVQQVERKVPLNEGTSEILKNNLIHSLKRLISALSES